MSSGEVVIRGVTVVRGGRAALSVDRLELPAGSVVAVIGANGSGKSTLLDVIAGVVDPSTGAAEVGGRPAGAAGSDVAYVPQSTSVPAHLPITVGEAVAMGLYREVGAWRRMGLVRRARIHEAMVRLDIAGLADRQIHELSGGQRQRVLIAQGLVAQAPVLLLDEPVTGLDAPSRQRILDAVGIERAAGRTVVMATHDLDDARAADLVVLLAGRLVAAGAPEEVLVPRHLGVAYGGRLVEVGGVAVLVDDPHHHDQHHHDQHHHDRRHGH